MLYLKCTECGYNNVIRSETILFCEKCNKKLHNNFRDWHKLHPDKTFDDFAKMFCISEFDLTTQSIPAKKNNKSKTLVIVLVSIFLFLIIAGVVGFRGIKKFLDNNFSTQTNESVFSGKWDQKTIGSSDLIIDLPFELSKQELKLSETVTNMIDTLESFSHTSDKGFKVLVFYSVYKNGIEASLDGAVQGAVNEVQNIKGITNFVWNRTDTMINNKMGAIVTCQYNLITYAIQMKSLIVCHKNYLWQVATQFSEDDMFGKKASEKVLSSVDIKK